MDFLALKNGDPEVFDLIQKETERQKETINLIASENVVPPAVLEALATPLSNKYSEGYPGKRYYPGTEIYDNLEKLCQERALKLFALNSNDWGVNVQPLSGSPANLAIYSALLNPGDTILAMDLAAGGHLSHATKISLSGKIWHGVFYGLDKNELLDYDAIERQAMEEKPRLIIAGASAYPREIDFNKFSVIAKKCGAYLLADISHIAGLIATSFHPTPFPFADVVMTTTQKTLRGPRGALIFARTELMEKINRAVFPGVQGGPHNNVIAAKAVALKLAATKDFVAYQDQVLRNAEVLVRVMQQHEFPALTSGTDTHMGIIDLRSRGIDGGRAETLLAQGGVLVNREMLPGDIKASAPSGIRVGTPAVTSRGLKEPEIEEIGKLIASILLEKIDANSARERAKDLMKKFPLPY